MFYVVCLLSSPDSYTSYPWSTRAANRGRGPDQECGMVGDLLREHKGQGTGEVAACNPAWHIDHGEQNCVDLCGEHRARGDGLCCEIEVAAYAASLGCTTIARQPAWCALESMTMRKYGNLDCIGVTGSSFGAHLILAWYAGKCKRDLRKHSKIKRLILVT